MDNQIIIHHSPIESDKNPFAGQVQSSGRDQTTFALSPLGTQVMQEVVFQSVSYTDRNTGRQRKTAGIKFINILISVSQQKKIITTEIPGRDGTIKEYIGMDDYEITFNGTINGANGHHPADEIIALKDMLIPYLPTPVVNTYLNNLGIFHIVVKDFSLDQEAGGYSKQAFTIQALSDADVILQVI